MQGQIITNTDHEGAALVLNGEVGVGGTATKGLGVDRVVPTSQALDEVAGVG